MDDPTNEQRPRASLRGKGREILLGQRSSADSPSGTEDEQTQRLSETPQRPDHVDAASLPLSPEETAALLDFSPDSPAYDAGVPLPAASARPAGLKPEPAVEPVDEEELPDWLPMEQDEAFDVPAWMQDSGPDAGVPAEAAAPAKAGVDVRPGGDAVPLGERDQATLEPVPYEPHPALDDLNPVMPEHWSQPPAEPEASAGPLVLPRRATRDAGPEDEGGLLAPDVPAEEVTPAAPSGLPDPFGAVPARQASEQLFEPTAEPDQSLLALLVDDDHIRKLSQQIEALQEELVQRVQSDRTSSDLYMDELLHASSLLMASRENYDDARAIVYRIRADMNRQRKVNADISRYRPLLLNYLVGWGIALIVLFLLKGLFTGVTDAVGVGIVSALYYPMLLGVSGALISGYLTLERHTTRLRDFDPIHISWYLFNPLLGGVMGLLMFLIASIANEDLLRESATDAEYAITYLLCVVAGMNQNNVLRQLNDLLKRFGRSSQN